MTENPRSPLDFAAANSIGFRLSYFRCVELRNPGRKRADPLMEATITDQIRLVEIRGPRRLLLLLPIAAMVAAVYFCAGWYFGNTLAEFAPSPDQGGRENAEAAVRLAPADPLTHWVLATQEKGSLDATRWPAALQQYQEAVRLSPNDYRLWMDLGRAREQSGDTPGGEAALRRAIQLAPNYGYPRWYLGNLLLRQGRREDAFVELRKAGEATTTFRPQIFVLAWHFYDQDVHALEALAGDDDARAQLALFLARPEQAKPDDAVRIWKAIPAAARQEQLMADTGKIILRTLYDASSLTAAAEMERSLQPDRAPTLEKISNPGFEEGIGGADASLFAWRANSVPQATVSFDTKTFHTGNRSLQVNFNGYGDMLFINIWQPVLVLPDRSYRLEFFVKTSELVSIGPPVIEVFDPQDPKNPLATQTPGITGTNDWQAVKLDFKTTPKTQAVMIRSSRVPCASACQLFGTIWYDDFTLQPGAPAAQPTR